MIDTIFVDLGDTFRVIRKDDAYSHAAKTRIRDLLGAEAETDAGCLCRTGRRGRRRQEGSPPFQGGRR